jgi:hypothetical protein
VHLLRANGAKLAVRATITTHEDGEHVRHVVRVTPAAEDTVLDQQRLVLTLGAGGTITAVNAGATKALFGFKPQDLVGKPARSLVNVLADCSARFGDDARLLAALGIRALEGTEEAWRVGVTLPSAPAAAAASAVVRSGDGDGDDASAAAEVGKEH